ncbi:4-hydroxy-3-methylbut-2-enyl diphosphate reductase [Candidatus Profftia sp. (ex Adelges kitamiensis)]|uniref:4-hydroxy-3-methylbut-2-enyl diphosphate reductase n=1 Tax=Candidatus Profftia sp. (ex Adelges kitamiensis) TaxID=2864218 RepID=UPI001CE295AF|nr:4-hydroxy-3-methylbut-2-enyl diphosphate reductase [Candidatus Profftia sp. (ex Adelges kitamiensis)]
MQILLANPRGFCAGVNRALSIVKRALKIYGSPIYVFHEIVHNRYISNTMREIGVIFIEKISEVPDNSILIFSAHGVSKIVCKEAKSRNLTMIFDATCPLVTTVHMEVSRASRKGMEAILIGHAGHPEVEGTMSQYNNQKGGIYLVESLEDVWNLQVRNENNLCFMMQTTLSVDYTSDIVSALKKRFVNISSPRQDNICYATINRQEAIRNLITQSEVILVVGSQNSSNSTRLVELVHRAGVKAFLIDSAKDIQEDWLKNVDCIGVTAGASAPEILVQNVIKYLKILKGGNSIEIKGIKEKVYFKIPKELRVNLQQLD